MASHGSPAAPWPHPPPDRHAFTRWNRPPSSAPPSHTRRQYRCDSPSQHLETTLITRPPDGHNESRTPDFRTLMMNVERSTDNLARRAGPVPAETQTEMGTAFPRHRRLRDTTKHPPHFPTDEYTHPAQQRRSRTSVPILPRNLSSS